MPENARRTFDRTRDVPKIIGCNERNVEYRWGIFEKFLAQVPAGSKVLDFGAGSLRETYELARRGYQVTAIDLNEETLLSYQADYDWSQVPCRPEIIAGNLGLLGNQTFALITAFDVFEHLENPKELLAAMRGVLHDGGLIFCSVPNRRSLFEIMFRANWKLGLARGRVFPPGEPHIQFKSPDEWRTFFTTDTGFCVVDHQMAIGFLVNTWAAISQIPTLLIRKILRRANAHVDEYGPLASKRVMSALNSLDQRTEAAFKGYCAWNLIVLQKTTNS